MVSIFFSWGTQIELHATGLDTQTDHLNLEIDAADGNCEGGTQVICIYVFMRIHTYIQTYPLLLSPSNTHSHTCTHTQTRLHTFIRTGLRKNWQMYRPRRRYPLLLSPSKTHLHKCKNTHAHIHTSRMKDYWQTH